MGNKYYEQGNFELETKAFSGTPSAPAYTGDVNRWYGLMEINLETSQDVTEIAADDDATYLEMKPPMILTGTIKVTGMKVSDFSKLFNVRADSNGMYLFGSRAQDKTVGIAFKNTGYDDDGVYATNKFIMFRAKVTLPPIGTESLNSDGDTIRDFTLNIRASYVKYTYTDNGTDKTDTATYGMFNSVDNADVWDKVKDGIFAPNETLPEDPTPEPEEENNLGGGGEE